MFAKSTNETLISVCFCLCGATITAIALIQNTSPSRSKPATTDNALKGDASPSMETTSSVPDLTVEHCQAREFEVDNTCTYALDVIESESICL
jgi:hypothetical protein